MSERQRRRATTTRTCTRSCIIFPFVIFCSSVLLFIKFYKQNLASSELFSIDVGIAKNSVLDDESNVRIPKDKHGAELSVEERLRYLELKTNAFMGFGTNPFFGVQEQASHCENVSSLHEFGCKLGWEGVKDSNSRCVGLFDHRICIDNLPKPGTKYELNQEDGSEQNDTPCLIYDFGIRAEPQFGAVMARTFGCEVHGFDPSPVSNNWWESDRANELRKLPNYHFHPYGAGGIDGDIVLKDYNWGQVSILRYPSMTVHCKDNTFRIGDNVEADWEMRGQYYEGEVVGVTSSGDNVTVRYSDEKSVETLDFRFVRHTCDLRHHSSKDFKLPVKTLPTIMKELRHEGRSIDILKIDVEGSEYAFLEQLLDVSGGCPDFIKQITLEWHHFSFDPRYGEGASPPINTIATLLNSCGLKNIWQQ